MHHAALSYIAHGKKILGVYNPKYDAWALPGGKVEQGESLAHAQQRELYEETWLTTRAAVLMYDAAGSADPTYLVHVFFVAASGNPITREPGNTVRWITKRDLCASKTFGPFYRAFFAWLASREGGR